MVGIYVNKYIAPYDLLLLTMILFIERLYLVNKRGVTQWAHSLNQDLGQY